MTDSASWVQELSPAPAVTIALQTLADWPGVILFDSAETASRRGRYSFLTADPVQVFQARENCDADPLEKLQLHLSQLARPPLSGLPPFQGGAAGYLSYEYGQRLERLPRPRVDEFSWPQAWVGLYDWTLAWDHQQQRCWLISQDFRTSGDGGTTPQDLRARQVLQRLSSPPGASPAPATRKPVIMPATAKRSELPGFPGVESNFSRASYLEAVTCVIEYIRAGDIFQANLSQRLLARMSRSPVEHYLALRTANPAPFAGYLAADDWAILSSSPERFLQLTEDRLGTRPIKGTRQRRTAPEADLFTRDELRESEKDRAENVMIVDLLRNDLSRVCRAGTIRVPELCTVETYQTVSHLVSEVSGQLRPGATYFDALKVAFPGGSITGAPKIRAMEIITELEQVARGPYCGCLFYASCSGAADSNILIRTLCAKEGWLTFPAGGGIVAQSDPAAEYEETLHKAQGLLRSLRV